MIAQEEQNLGVSASQIKYLKIDKVAGE